MISALESIAYEVLALVSGGCQCQPQQPVPQQQEEPPTQSGQLGQPTDTQPAMQSSMQLGDLQSPKIVTMVNFFGTGQPGSSTQTPMQA